jgi:5-hydroxyisourate hydrolase
MSGRITTHVLDLAGGKPVVGIAIELWYLGEGVDTFSHNNNYVNKYKGAPRLLGTFETNHDGRVDQPLLEGASMMPGVYELIFDAGDYFRRAGHLSAITDHIFDWIPIRFRIGDAGSHYHVPLLVAPGGYSTYRGS